MNILIAGTQYSMLLYMLINPNWEKTYYIFPISFSEDIVKKFQEKQIKYYKSTELKKNLIKYYYNRIKFLLTIKRLKNYKVFGNDYSNDSYMFRKTGIVLIEDGLANYLEPKLNKLTLRRKIKNWIRLYFPQDNYLSFGYSNEVKEIYLTGLGKIPQRLENKVKTYNLKNLWKKKLIDEKKEILNIFNLEIDKMFKLNEKIIFLTQPLSEDGLLSLEEEIELYREIFKNYDLNKLVIKTHPREIKDYSKYFSNIEILNRSFPFEFFNLMDIEFQKIVTIFSTAALSLGERSKIDFYGTEVHSKILEKVGSCNNIIRRNCFLKEE